MDRICVTPETVLDNLRMSIKKQGLTQSDIAKLLGYKSYQSVSNLFRSGHYLKPAQARPLCDRFGFSFEYLTKGMGSIEPKTIAITYPKYDLQENMDISKSYRDYLYRVAQTVGKIIDCSYYFSVLNELDFLSGVVNDAKQDPNFDIRKYEEYFSSTKDNIDGYLGLLSKEIIK